MMYLNNAVNLANVVLDYFDSRIGLSGKRTKNWHRLENRFLIWTNY